jgi:N-acyl-D-amino-acid deacylase
MVEESIREAIRIGEESGVGVQIAHVKVGGRENWGKMDRVLRLIDEARARGVDVTGDVYPYHAGSTKMDNLMPSWAHDGGIPRLLERLADRPTRRRIMEECLVDGERWRTVSQGAVGFDRSDLHLPPSRTGGPHPGRPGPADGQTPAESSWTCSLRAEGHGGMVSFSQNLENVAKVLAHPAIMIGSDSIGLSGGRGPPSRQAASRMCRTFPRVLGSTRASGACSRWRPRSTR